MADSAEGRHQSLSSFNNLVSGQDDTALLKDIIDDTPIILFYIDHTGIIRLAQGKGLEKINSGKKVVGSNVFSCLEAYPKTLEHFRQAMAGREFTAVEEIGQRKFEFCYQPRHDPASAKYHVTGIATDITDLKRTEQALLQNRELLADAQKIARLGNWTCCIDHNGKHHSPTWSDEIFKILGLKKQPPNGKLLVDMIHEEDRPHFLKAVEDSRHNIKPYNVEYRIIRPDGKLRFINERGIARRNEQGDQVSLHGTMQDVTEQRRTEHTLQKATNFDALTGLPNRILFKEHLRQALAQSHRNRQYVALLALDLDNFKHINESLGHQTGDRLLLETGERLKDSVREGDTVSRFGGDEFIVIMEGITHTSEISVQAQKIIQNLNHQYHIGGHEVFCSTSIGIACYPMDAGNADDLIKHTGTALSNAKEQGKNTYQFYTRDMNSRILERLLLENALRHALEREEFEIHYQPQIDLLSGKITGIEALLRWRHPQMGLISPTQFIPLAEQNGLIVAIGKWVMETACHQAQQWIEDGHPPMRMSVNLSAHQVAQPGLSNTVKDVLDKTGLKPQLLKLELTESILLDDSSFTRNVLHHLHALGVKLTIDDFGTGYSSLSYLKRIPLDTLKIDRSFIQDLPQNSDDAAISQAIIAMARSLGMKVIAEGVESQEQLTFLSAQKCDEAQGYFFSEPKPAAELGVWLNKQAHGSRPF